MKELTIKDVYNMLEKQMLQGNGDKILLVTDDEEGNGYHALWYDVTAKIDDIRQLIDYGIVRGYEAEKIVVIG